MKCIISHPNIAPYIKESVLAYQEHELLLKFYTTYFQHPDYPFTKNLIRAFPRFEKEFKRRSISEIRYNLIKGHPYYELLRTISARGLNSWIENRIWQQTEYNFDHWVARQLNSEIKWVHTYEHAALKTLLRAKQLGIQSFYEQPSQHHDFLTLIVKQQISKYPELNCPSTQLMLDAKAVTSDKRKDKELMACDYIICNSKFTSDTLVEGGIQKEKIIKIAYGFPPIQQPNDRPKQRQKMTFLFAGNQCLRKGVHILYKAWISCNFNAENTELVIIGKNQLPNSIRNGLSSVRFIPNIPQSEMMDFYQEADVFVLPTLADGFGMVISEAMSKGLPVITTMNSGGPDIITHGKDGFLVEADKVDALANQMKWCFENQETTRAIGINALERASRYPWKEYRRSLVSSVVDRVNQHSNDTPSNFTNKTRKI